MSAYSSRWTARAAQDGKDECVSEKKSIFVSVLFCLFLQFHVYTTQSRKTTAAVKKGAYEEA